MKRIGLIGGLSPESTVHYYQILCREFNRTRGGLNFPELILVSLNMQVLADMFQRDDWDGVAGILRRALVRLRDAGADFAAILANTPHNAMDRVGPDTPLDILTIMDATTDALRTAGRRRVGLLGTKATMEYGFFQRHFTGQGIETRVPDAPERARLDRIIWDELSHGRVAEASRDFARELLRDLENKGVDAVILGCTELPLLFQAEDTSLPLYDTTRLHAEAILAFARAGDGPVPSAGGTGAAGAGADEALSTRKGAQRGAEDLAEPSSPVCYLKDFPVE